MTDACTSPGSRSTPLVLAIAREPRLRAHSHIDERSSGFFALGVAKATGRAVALACTSGTAAANLAPAVIEASEARVPLIVLTADRPPELREIGAGQTIDQIKLYGDAVRWFFEVGNHEATPERIAWIRALACRAWVAATGDRPGPVHLNWPLREPLVTAAGYPLLADPLSGARRGRAAIAHYDALLRDAGFAGEHAPEVVVRVGDLPTSKPLRAWLGALDGARQILVDAQLAWQDPASVVELLIRADPRVLEPPPAAEPGWLEGWRAADALAAGAIEEILGEQLSEPNVARAVADTLPSAATVFVAASMPVRDLESFWPVRDDAPRVLSNRGANGIDGTLASALGVAAAVQGPVVALIGDVAFAHDAGSLLAASRLGLSLTVVLINNGGAAVFDYLPIAREHDVYEQYVATPTGLDFERAAALYGFRYERPETLDGLRGLLAEPAPATLIEVRTDRAAGVALHERVWSAVARSRTA